MAASAQCHQNRAPEYAQMVWCEGAGTVCKPFSTMATNPPWLDPSTLSTLMWAFSTRFDEPRHIHHECVTPFQHEVFIGRCSQTEGVLKDPMAKPLPLGVESQGYIHQVKVFSPTVVGVPSERTRKYTHFEWVEGLA